MTKCLFLLNFLFNKNFLKKSLKFRWADPIFDVTGKVGFMPKVREL